MKEGFEITAIRLARVVLQSGPKDALALAKAILEKSEAEDCPPPRDPEAIVDRPKRDPLPVHIRWMVRSDMPEVLAIESDLFEFAWNEEAFVKILRQRNAIGMVCDYDEQIVAYMIYELHKTRFDVRNFGVRRDMQGRTIGRQMADKLKSKLSQERRRKISLEVRETNLDALLFFRSLGFRAVSILRDFYDNCAEDAILMEFALAKCQRAEST